jgi:CubicO group peptidase (beta-lactamase class C family)
VSTSPRSLQVADVEEFLAREAEERVFGTGGQLYVSVDGTPVLDLAVGVDGLDAPVDRDTLFAVYCAGKPVLALALAALVGDGEVSWDDRVGDVIDARPLPEHVAGLRVDALLSHTAGLHRLSSVTYLASPPRVRDALALSTRPPDGWRPGDVAYSEVAAWHVLGLVVEALAGEPARAVARRRVLDPAGTGDDLFVAGMTDEEYDAHRGRIGVNAQVEGPSMIPLLAERNRRMRTLASPAIGNTASARGLGRLYEAILAARRTPASGPLADAVPPDALAALVTPHSHGADPVMNRTCGYGLGVMVGLGEHDFGSRVGAGAFGHSGFRGMTAAFADPAHGLVVACHLNGSVDPGSALGYRRPALVDTIYRAVVGA